MVRFPHDRGVSLAESTKSETGLLDGPSKSETGLMGLIRSEDTVTLPIVSYEVPRVAAEAVAVVGLGAMVVLDVIAWPIPLAIGLGALLARRR